MPFLGFRKEGLAVVIVIEAIAALLALGVNAVFPVQPSPTDMLMSAFAQMF